MTQRFIEGALGEPNRSTGDGHAERRERLQHQREPASRLADQVVRRDVHAVEHDVAEDVRRNDLVRMGDGHTGAGGRDAYQRVPLPVAG